MRLALRFQLTIGWGDALEGVELVGRFHTQQRFEAGDDGRTCGGREFHGTGYWYKRHEMFNAQNFFNNRSGLAQPHRATQAAFR